MGGASKIEWTEATWNPVTGCSKISPGCLNCYAEKFATRLQAMGNKHYIKGFDVNIHEDLLDIPLKWKKPRIVFVNSMSDLFHEEIPLWFLENIFDVMSISKSHTFQVLTKRVDKLIEIDGLIKWPSNVWMGVSVENEDYTFRIEKLKMCGARIKFVSFEPLLGPISIFNLDEIDWVIAGGESGPKARKINYEWVKGIRDRCINYGVPFFFKQWGGKNKKRNGRILDGKLWNEMPRRYEFK